MAQDITLLGASYQAVPAVTLPKTGGGTASFTDVTDTTAAAADVATGKYFYTAAGVRTEGTSSGGGGSDTFSDYINGDIDTFYSDTVTTVWAYRLRTGGLKIAVFPNVATLASQYAMGQSLSLQAVDFGGSLSDIPGTAFANSSALNVLILRKSDGIVTLTNRNAFNGSKFADNQSGGTLYVPNALISSYQGATNWSTILGYANNSIQKIEGSYYETHYADGTVIS